MNNTLASIVRRLLMIAIVLVGGARARAQLTYTWDPTGTSTHTESTGTWDLASAKWNNGTSDGQVWANASSPGNNAVIGWGSGSLGTPGTIKLNAQVTVDNLTFALTGSSTGYQISQSSGGMTFDGGTVTDNNTAASSTLTKVAFTMGSGLDFTKAGSGTLIMSSCTFSGGSGNLVVSAGTLQMLRPSFPVGTWTINGTFDFDGNSSTTTGDLNGSGTVTDSTTSSSHVWVMGGANGGTFSGAITIGQDPLKKAGSGTQTFSGTSTYTGATTVSAGTLIVTNGGVLGTTAVTVDAAAYFGGTGTCGGNVTYATSALGDFTITPSGGANTTPLAVSGTLACGSSLQVWLNAPANLGVGTYVLATSGGTPTGSVIASADFLSGSLAGGDTGTVSLNTSTKQLLYTVTVSCTAPTSETVSGTTTICTGNSATISMTGQSGVTYQLYAGASPVQSTQTGTGGTLNWSVSPTSTTTYTVQTTTAGGYCGGVVMSGSAVITVNPTSVGGTATPGSSEICLGSSTTVSVSGNTGTIAWQQSPDGSSWSPVSGGSGATAATYTTPALTTTTYYQAVSTSGVCSSAASTSAKVTVDPTSVSGTASGSTTICNDGTSTATLTLSGNTGTIQWQQSATGGGGWASVSGGSGATTTSYTTPPLTATTYYRALVTSGTCSSATSGTVTVTVSPPSVGGTANGSTTICNDGSSTATLTLSGNTGSTIQWQQSPDGSTGWATVTGGSGATTTSYTTPPLTTTTYYRAMVTSGTCSSANSSTATVTVNQPPVITGGTPADQTVAVGAQATFTVSTTAGTSPTYQWQVNKGSGFANVDPGGADGTGGTTASFTTVNTTLPMTGYQYQCVVGVGSCSSATSRAATLTVTSSGTKILITLPGETYTSGSGNSGTASQQVAGIPFALTLEAVQSDGVTLDTSYTGQQTNSFSGPGGSPVYTTVMQYYSGIATNVITTLTLAQTTQITAFDSINGRAGIASSSLTVIPGAISAANSTVTPATASVSVESSQVITVTARDAYNNNVGTAGTGQTVVFSNTGSGTLGSVSDNGNGTYTVTLTPPHTVGSDSVTATLNGTAVGTAVSASSAAITYTSGVANAGNSVISAAPGSITANGSSTSIIMVTEYDQYGNALTASGVLPVLGTDLGALGTVTDNLNGTYSATLTSGTVAGTAHLTGTIGGTAIGTPTTVTFTPGAVSASVSTATANPTTGVTADGSTTSTITVTLKDANGNTVDGRTVTVSSTGTGNTISSVTDNGGGVYTATIKSTKAETKTITAADFSDSVTLTQQPTVVFVGGPVSAASSTITANPASINANGTSTITVTEKDAQGNTASAPFTTPVLATSLGTLSSVAGSGPTYTATLNPAGASGTANITGTISGTAIGTPASVTVAAVPVLTWSTAAPTCTDGSGSWSTTTAEWLQTCGTGTQVVWTNGDSAVIGSGGTAGTITLSGGPQVQNITFNAPSGYIITASDLHIFGTPANPSIFTMASGVTVNFGNSGGSSTEIQDTTAPNCLEIEGPGTFEMLNKSGDANTYSGGTFITSGTLTFSIANDLGAGPITLNGGTLSASAATALSLNNAVTNAANSTIGLATTGTGAVTYSGNWTLTGGTRTLTVNNPVANINLISGAIGDGGNGYGLTKAGSGALELNNTETYTGTTTVSAGTLALGASGVLNAASGVSIAAGGTFDVSAQATWTLGGSATLSASGTGTTAGSTEAAIKGGTTVSLGSQPVSLTWGGGSSGTDSTHPALVITAGALSLSGNQFTVVVPGSALSAGTYTLASAASISGGSSVNATPLYTGGNGVATGFAGTVSISGSTVILTVVDSRPTPSFSGLSSPTIIYGTASVSLSGNLAAAGPVYPVNGSTVSASINGHAVNGTITDGVGDFSINYNDASLATDPVNAYTITYSFAGDANVKPAANGSGTLTITAGPVSAGVSTVSASPSGVAADGSSASTITVTLTDAYGNPVSGKTVTLAQTTGTGASISAASGPSSSLGVVTFTVTSTTVGAAAFTATDSTDSITITQTASVNFTAVPSAANSTATATPPTGVTADGSTTSTINVTVLDSSSSPISDVTVTASSTGSGNTLSTPAVTDGSGHTSFTIKSTKAETKTITVTAGGVQLNQQPTVQFVPGTPTAAQSTATANPTTGVTADGSTTSTITVTLKDANGNTVDGKTVTVASTGSANTISSVTDNGGGVYTATISSTKAETKTITATDTSDPVTVSQQPTVQFVPGAVSAGTSTVSASPASVPANGSVTSTITVTLLDANGNPVSGKTVTLAQTIGSGASISAASGTSTALGVVTFTVKSSTTGSAAFTATDTTDSTTITQTAAVNFTAFNTLTLIVNSNAVSPWTVPAGITSIAVQMWGGGGGGGGALNNNVAFGGGGGGGGAYTLSTVSVTPGNTIAYLVGGGGVGVTGANGSAGTNSTFVGATTANGGGGGVAAATSTGGAASTGGTFNGGVGAAGTTTYGGGGGSSGGTGANGNPGSTSSGGAAVTGGGAGGGGATSSANGGLGTAGSPGGGGGGGFEHGTTARPGANGGNGQIIITYSVETPSFSNLANDSIYFGQTSITLSGKVSAAGPLYPASGETVTATINGHAVSGTVTDTSGDFSINYNDASLATDPVNTYTITYSYGSDVSLGSASDASTTLTVQPRPLPTLNAAYYNRVQNESLKMTMSDLLANGSDPDPQITLTMGYISPSTNGTALFDDGTYIYYTNSTPVNVNDAFKYYVMDGFGDDTTNEVFISIIQTNGQQTPNPGIMVSGSSVSVTFFGVPGYVYDVERNTNLGAGAGWVDITNVTTPAGGVFTITDWFNDVPNPPPGSAYYRLLVP